MSGDISLQKVSPSTVAVVDHRLVSNVAAVVFSDHLVVIDSGVNPPLARVFRETLEAEYKRPVRLVCVTHYHVDHIAGLSAFADVAVVGSSALLAKLRDLPGWAKAEMEESRQKGPGGLAGAHEPAVVLPTVVFDDQVTIAGDKPVDFRHCGGHTDCSTYGYLAEEGVLFAGDLIVAGEFPFMGDATADPEVWMSVLRGWKEMDVQHVIPGHGPVSGPEAIDAQLNLLELLKNNTLAVIKAGKDHAQIAVPDTPPVAEGHGWFVDRFRERWYAYYADKAKDICYREKAPAREV